MVLKTLSHLYSICGGSRKHFHKQSTSTNTFSFYSRNIYTQIHYIYSTNDIHAPPWLNFSYKETLKRTDYIIYIYMFIFMNNSYWLAWIEARLDLDLEKSSNEGFGVVFILSTLKWPPARSPRGVLGGHGVKWSLLRAWIDIERFVGWVDEKKDLIEMLFCEGLLRLGRGAIRLFSRTSWCVMNHHWGNISFGAEIWYEDEKLSGDQVSFVCNMILDRSDFNK